MLDDAMRFSRTLLPLLGLSAVTLATFASVASAQLPGRDGSLLTEAKPMHTVKKARKDTSVAGTYGMTTKTSEWTYTGTLADLTPLEGEPGRLVNLAFFETGAGSDKPLEIRALYYLPYSINGMAARFFGFGCGWVDRRYNAQCSHWLTDSSTTNPSWQSLKLGAGTTKSAQLIGVSPDEAIAGIRVCTNRKGDKIKGAEVYGARFDNRGNPIHDDSIKSKFERPNCHTWSPVVRCEAGQVAVGVKAYAETASKGFSGMSLICASYTTNRNGVALDVDVSFPISEPVL